MLLGSRCEISDNGDWVFTQNFAARLMSIVVCPGEPCLARIKDYKLFGNEDVLRFQKTFSGILRHAHVQKYACLVFFDIFFKNGSPEQTTMLMRRAAKFCVEPRSPFFEIFHQESKTLGKPSNKVCWPECQPEFPSDGGGGGDGFPRTLPIWPGPWAITPRDQISREGNPSLRF